MIIVLEKEGDDDEVFERRHGRNENGENFFRIERSLRGIHSTFDSLNLVSLQLQGFQM